VYKQLLKQAAHLAAHKANSAHSEEQGARRKEPGARIAHGGIPGAEGNPEIH